MTSPALPEPNLSRRAFLRGLVAAAVATQVANLLPEEANAFIDQTTEQLLKIKVNGKEVEKLSMTEVGNGWWRVSADFKAAKGKWPSVQVDFTSMKGGGLYVGEGGVQDAKFDLADYTFSCYIKRNTSTTGDLYHPQLESKV